MFQSKKPKSMHDIRHARKFHLRTDPSCDTQCPRAFEYATTRIIAEHVIFYHVVMDGQSFGLNQ